MAVIVFIPRLSVTPTASKVVPAILAATPLTATCTFASMTIPDTELLTGLQDNGAALDQRLLEFFFKIRLNSFC
jgi:hypothetical protein